MFNQSAPQENTAELGFSSSCLVLGVLPRAKEIRAVAGEPARARNSEVQSISNMPC